MFGGMAVPSDLTDQLYDAALMPNLWAGALEDLAAWAGGAGGVIVTFAPARAVLWRTVDRFSDEAHAFSEGGGWERSLCTSRLLEHPSRRFQRVSDLMSAAELSEDPGERSLRRLGVTDMTTLVTTLPTGEVGCLALSRWIADGPFDRIALRRLDDVRHHLSRAMLLAARLGLERCVAMTEALERLALPAAVLSADGRILAANALLADSEVIRLGAMDRLILRDRHAREDLTARLAVSPAGHAAIPLRDADGALKGVFHVVALKGESRAFLTGASHLCYITEPAKPASSDIFMAAFGLTAAEAAVAAKVASGNSVEQIAAQRGVAVSTLRSQLHSIFRKTGTSRQAELAGLAAALTAFGGRK